MQSTQAAPVSGIRSSLDLHVHYSVAGSNMAGRPERYAHLPFFYSDLFNLGYEAVGSLSSSPEMLEDWQEPFRKWHRLLHPGGQDPGRSAMEYLGPARSSA